MYKLVRNEPFLNKAINYIVENISEPPSLEEIASLSSFSKFHFHRMFKDFTGETLSNFIRRIRLEKSVFLLVFETHRSISDIAMTCGYGNTQSFNKAFKKFFNLTPNEYKMRAKQKKDEIIFNNKETSIEYQVSIKYLKSFKIVYHRNFGAYSNTQTNTFQNISKQRYPTKEFIGICWDDPNVTKDENCRYDTGYILNTNEDINQDMMIQEISDSTYALLKVNIKKGDFELAWEYLLYNWLPKHGYTPKRIFCFEKIIEFPSTKNNFVHKAELYIPIHKL